MENKFFPEIKGNLGFGCMRLPMGGTIVGDGEFKKMIDVFFEAGFNYFDTAHGYLMGQSEKAIRRCLTSRFPREKYILTDKLTENYFKKQEDIRPFFESQLKACGVDYFDFYLMHAQGATNYEKYKACRAYETAFELKAEGKIRHVGISFHDTAEYLDKILTEYPQIEVVQIQFNYLDYDDPAVQSRRVYDVCVKHNKPVLVMEPVKGGNLVNLPKEALALLTPRKVPQATRYASPRALRIWLSCSPECRISSRCRITPAICAISNRSMKRSLKRYARSTRFLPQSRSYPAPPAATALRAARRRY